MHLTTDVVTIGGPIFGAVVLVILLLRKVIPLVRRIVHFLDDWFGEPERPGVAKRTGVMERLTSLEQRMSTVEAELKPNGGNSMYDKVTRVDQAVAPETK